MTYCRRNTLSLSVIYYPSVVTYVYLPFFISKLEDRALPYRGWSPFGLDNVNVYYATYLHQALAVTRAAMVNTATETLVSEFMLQVCAQFEILEERFAQFPQMIKEMRANGEPESKILAAEKSGIRKLVAHHLRIFELTKILNDVYVFVILTQFAVSIIILCVCTYNLALFKPFDNNFNTIFLFTLCMLLQIFLYTWYGNEITLRSTDLGSKIFLSDWRCLSSSTIKDLLFILMRTNKPIILSSGYVINLSNAAFTSIVKTSYSVYNVLSVN